MKKKLVYCLLLLFSILLQISVLPVVMQGTVTADSMLMLILAWSVLDGFAPFLGWAVFAGVLYDLLTYSIVGTHALVFLAVVYFVSFFSRRLSVEVRGASVILLLFFVPVVTLISRGIMAFLISWDAGSLEGFWKAFGDVGSISLQTVYNMVFFLLWFTIIRKTKKLFNFDA